MVTHGNSCIFRCTGASDTETNVTSANDATAEKIEFDSTNVIPDTTGHIHMTEADMKCGIAENEKPFGNINELQDTKLETITLTVTGTIQNPVNTFVSTIFKKWMIEDKTDKTVFPKGRFGLRMDDFPSFNLQPKTLASGTARGYILQDIKLIREGETKGKIAFVATLRFAGDVGTTPSYSW